MSDVVVIEEPTTVIIEDDVVVVQIPTEDSLVKVGDLDLTGPPGATGAPGISAYQVAVDNGFVGTESEWLTSLIGEQGPIGPEGPEGPIGLTGPAGLDGDDGPSAYEVAVANGFVGTESEWLASLVGEQGPVGPEGPEGPIGLTGPAGPAGADGVDGPSAYAVAVANGFVGTESAWLASLVGAQGPEGSQGLPGEPGPAGAEGPQGPAGPSGPPGPAGADGPQGPPGPAGADGLDGASAYEIAVANGFIGTEQEWLASLEGDPGPEGPQGPIGPAGADGADGRDVQVVVASSAPDPLLYEQGDRWIDETTAETYFLYDDGTSKQWVQEVVPTSNVGEVDSFIFTQSVAASVWTINHNLGFKPSVELFNSGSQEIEADIVHTSTIQTVVTFNLSITGFARLT